MAAGSSTSSSSHHHRSGGARGSASSSSSSTFSTSSLFRTNGRLASVGSTVGERIPDYIPGFKTSATFLSSLSANLRIPDDAFLPSPISTPASLRAADALPSHAFPPPSPLTSAMSSDELDSPHASSVLLTPATSSADDSGRADPLAGVPALSTCVVTDEQDRVEALRLVADSVAQQRQLASRILISNPLNVCGFGVLLALVGQYLYKGPGDWAILFTTYVGLTMMGLVLVRWLVGPYLVEAERVNWAWLGDDMVVATKYGDKIIGALVMAWESGSEKGKSKKKKGGKGLIRAWAVQLKYRGKGEGRALMEEAVQVTQKKGGDGLEFDEHNVYSTRVLPKIYNSGFDRRDQKARASLDKVIKEQGSFSKRR